MLSLCFVSSAFAVLITAVLLAGIAFFAFPYLGLLPTLMLLFLVEIIAVSLIRRTSLKELSGIGTLLFDKCDPDAYIRENERLLRRLSSRSRYYATVKSNLAVGYYSRGETEKGMEICRSLIAEKQGSAGAPILPVLYMNLCTMLLSLKRTEEAKEIFDKAYSLVLKFPENSPVGRQYRGQMNLLELRRRVMSETPDNYETQLLQRFNRAASVYERVNVQQLLSVLYSWQGDRDKYRSSLQYIAAKGNKLFIACEARKALENV